MFRSRHEFAAGRCALIAVDDFHLPVGPAERISTLGEPFLDAVTFAMVLDLSGTALADVDDGQSFLML